MIRPFPVAVNTLYSLDQLEAAVAEVVRDAGRAC